MSRNNLAFGASILAISVASLSIAQAQQSLPTIDVGGSRRAASAKQAGIRGAGRTTGAATAPSAQQPAIVAAPVASTIADPYATPKPAPFSRTLPSNIPAVVEGRTRQQVENSVNYVTSAQAFKYLPSVTIRERFPGDRPILSGRTVGTAGTAQTLVYADNILLSNLLGNGFAFGQRTDLISPEEIERVDVMYGPFSALFPGNSIGGVFAITTRMPESFEVHARGVGTAQTFSQNGYSDTPLTGNINLMVGDKINDFRYFLVWNHLDASGQPLQFSGGTLAPTSANAFSPFANTTGPAFVGGEYGFQQNGFPRILTGATGIQRNIQDLGKVKLSYDVAPLTRLTYQAGFWNNDLNVGVESYIRDRNGLPIYNTQTGSLQYYQPGSTNPARGLSVTRFGAMNPAVGGSQHLMQSLQFKRDTGGLLDFDLSFSTYNYLRDFNNSARAYGMLPNNNLARGGAVGANPATTPNIGASGWPYLFNQTGLNTQLDGTYWRTGDVRFVYRPDANLLGRHEFSFGGHTDVYSLNQVQTQTAFYPSNAYFGVSQYNRGKTSLQGIYLQDAWKVHDQVKLILGARGDFWEAYNGQNVSGGLDVQNNRAWGATNANSGLLPVTNIGGMTSAVNFLYPSTRKGGFQPKAAIEWRPHDRYEARLSMGRAYRFPTVSELFSDVSIPGSITRANPGLQPEISTSWDFTQSFRFVDAFNGAVGLVNPRISFYLDDRWNAIERSQTTVGGVNITTNGNIGRARFRGIETALELRDVLVKGLGFSGSLTLQKSQVVSGGGLCNTTYVQTAAYIGDAFGCTTPFTPFPYVFPGVVPTPPTFYGFMLNGRTFPSIPNIRLRSVITYQPSDKLDMALGTRFNTATFTTVSNQDWNHDVYGSSLSTAILFDAKVNYRFARDWVATFGVDNIGNYKWYSGPHPYNMRTFYAGVKYDFVADKGRGGLFSPAVDEGSQEETLAFR